MEVVEVLGYGVDDEGRPTRRVRLADGTERTQVGQVTVETQITRADGSVEPGGEITDIQVKGQAP